MIAKEKKVVDIKIGEVIKNKKFVFATAATFFDSFASSSLFIFLPFLLLQRGVDSALLGTFAAAFFIGNFAGKTTLGRLVDRFGNVKVFILSEIFMSLLILLLAYSTQYFIIIVCSFILGIFAKGTVPVVQTMVSEAADHHGSYEKVFGMNAFVASVATTIAPIMLGFISDRYGISMAFSTMAIAAMIAVIPALGFNTIKRNQQ